MVGIEHPPRFLFVDTQTSRELDASNASFAHFQEKRGLESALNRHGNQMLSAFRLRGFGDIVIAIVLTLSLLCVARTSTFRSRKA
jgi:hypothetical protein